MSDVVVRLLVATAVVAVGLGAAAGARIRDRRRAALAPLDLSAVEGRLLFFTDSGCRRCAVARTRLDDLAVEYQEIAYQHEPDLMRRVGVTGVPLIVARDAAGTEVARIAGPPSRRALRRLLFRAGFEGG